MGIFPKLRGGGRGADPNSLVYVCFPSFFACQNHPVENVKSKLQGVTAHTKTRTMLVVVAHTLVAVADTLCNPSDYHGRTINIPD